MTALVLPDLAAEARAQLRAATTLTTEEFDDLTLLAGRVHGPALLCDAWLLGKIGRETVTATISCIWSMAEYPDRALTRREWRTLFAVAGYTRDGQAAERPTDPVELWRGTVPERRRDWSWTTDRAVAEEFAYKQVRGRPIGTVFRVLAPPSSLLCENTERDESEFVLDTRGLRIEDTSDAV